MTPKIYEFYNKQCCVSGHREAGYSMKKAEKKVPFEVEYRCDCTAIYAKELADRVDEVVECVSLTCDTATTSLIELLLLEWLTKIL